MTGKRRLVLACAAAALLLRSVPAAADDETKAKEHYFKGKQLVEEEAYDKAIIELETSYELNPVPNVLYNLALCYDQLQKYADAVRYYHRYLDEEKNPPEDIRTLVEERILKLNQFLGSLKVTADVDGAEVYIDGKKIGETPLGITLVETGTYDLAVKAAGYVDIEEEITIVSGETATRDFAMTESEKAAAKAGPEGGKKKLGPAAFGATIALTAALGITAIGVGAAAVRKDRKLADMTTADTGWKGVRDDRDRLALATDVLIGLASAAAVTSLVLVFFTSFKKEKKTSLILAPDLRAGSFVAGLQGSF
jgi:hypothetical protein